ncbi:hypothetical protein [Thioalkalivibrio sp. XN8]|uniref:hypothetical protein n=1 Tax=Thioalkalivibrio sp. XN8 TaxID=2712863 RepID=UPI0013EB1074|nr:hypothetical protein [Thioalkalivibrio sp. XN8]NGP53541.1 hypothetical protein [Thioalkalivibrio sp. XN8]
MSKAVDSASGTPVEGVFANLSPDAFHLWATHYYQCRQTFRSPDPFSPVPYFLLCRAIELEFKARHLGAKRQVQVKHAYWHDLVKSYNGLSASEQNLSDEEFALLSDASAIYKGKGFEYFDPVDALTGFSRFPDLALLDALAKKIISR